MAATPPSIDLARDARPFVRYARVSRVGGRSGESYISIPEQERTMDRLAREAGVQAGELLVDEDRSGGNLNREAFQRALDLIRAGKAGGILVATFDRFSRDEIDCITTLREVEEAGGRLLCGDGEATMNGSTAALVTVMRSAVSAFERRRKGEGLAAAVRNAVERGVHLGIPYGYQRSDGRGSPLAIHEPEAEGVRLAFRLRVEGHSWPAIAKALNAAGYRPRPYRRDGQVLQGVWTHKTVRQLVMNEVYMGVAFNSTHRTEGAHPPIVEPQVYAKANRTRGTKPLGRREGGLLTGLVRCSGCGYAMALQPGNGVWYYRCRAAQHGAGHCPAPAMALASAIEDWVTEAFAAEYLTGALEPSDDPGVQQAEQALGEAQALRRATVALAARMDADAATAGAADEQVREACAVERAAEAELSTARMRARSADLPPLLDRKAWDEAPLAERRHWLALVYAAVVVRRSARWREPVDERAVLLSRDDAPRESTRLIAHVVAM